MLHSVQKISLYSKRNSKVKKNKGADTEVKKIISCKKNQKIAACGRFRYAENQFIFTLLTESK